MWCQCVQYALNELGSYSISTVSLQEHCVLYVSLYSPSNELPKWGLGHRLLESLYFMVPSWFATLLYTPKMTGTAVWRIRKESSREKVKPCLLSHLHTPDASLRKVVMVVKLSNPPVLTTEKVFLNAVRWPDKQRSYRKALRWPVKLVSSPLASGQKVVQLNSFTHPQVVTACRTSWHQWANQTKAPKS